MPFLVIFNNCPPQPSLSFFCLYLKMAFKVVNSPSQEVTQFFWLSPMDTWSLHVNKFLFVFLLLIHYRARQWASIGWGDRSQYRIQKGRGEVIFPLLHNQRNWRFYENNKLKFLSGRQYGSIRFPTFKIHALECFY